MIKTDIPESTSQEFQSGEPKRAPQTKIWSDTEMNEDALMTDAKAFLADLPSLAGGAGRWVEYFKGERLLLVSRDERLWAIHHDKSLTRAQKYEQSQALFESTNRMELFISSSLSPVGY
jgi:hypothetical protein